jgi:hypothetical protein
MLRRFAIFTLLSGCVAYPQSPTGAIEGVVLDPSGAAVPKAAITVTEASTGRTLSQATNAFGRYSVLHLLPGTYTVTAQADKFATVSITGLVVNAGATVNGDITLMLGAVEERLTIRASAVAVDPARHVVDSVITEADIQTLPILSRNFLTLAGMAPGVTVNGGAALDPTKAFGYLAVGLSGRVGAGTRIQVDGIDVTDNITGSTLINTSMDIVHEFQITRSSLDPSAPMTSSGAVSVITKSGGNEVHGRGFLDHYNQDMAARPGYLNASPPFHQTRAGGMMSGPVRRDRLFWLAQIEGTYTGSRTTSISPQWPQLNFQQDADAGVRYATGRVDWNLRSSLRAFCKFQNEGNFTTVGGTSPYRNVDWASQHVIGIDIGLQRWTHSFRLGYVNFNNRIDAVEPRIGFLRTPQGDPYLLTVGSFRMGPYGAAPQSTGESTLQNNYDGSFFHGRHTLRFGGRANKVLTAAFVGPSPLAVSGIYNLASIAQVQARGANPLDPTQYPLNSFSIPGGRFYPTFAWGHGYPHGALYDTRTAAYVVDSLKASRRLIVDFGVRWEYDTGYFAHDPRVHRDPVLDTWVPGASASPSMPKDLLSPHAGFALSLTGSGKTVIRGGFLRAFEANLAENIDESAMLPTAFGGGRFGIAFVGFPNGAPLDADGKHARGDYSDLIGRPIADVIGLIGQLAGTTRAAYAASLLEPGGISAFTATRGTPLVFPGNQYKIPYTLQFNIGIQRELKPGVVVTADYVRQHGIGLPRVLPDFERQRDAGTLDPAAARAQMNRVLAGKSVDEWIAANPAGNISSFGLISDLVWPGLTPDFLSARFISGGFSLYRSIQVSLRGRQPGFGPFRDLSYHVSYTLSRAEATSADANAESFYMGSGVLNNRHWNARGAFGPTGLDRTHRLVVAPTLQIPGGFQIGSLWEFRTPSTGSILIPNFGGPLSGPSAAFGTDLDGDGRTDMLPGLGVGQFGRRVKTLQELNAVIATFNRTFAGSLTAYGNALVDRGLFTEAQLRRLGAVVPAIPAVPENNPNPWHNVFVTGVKLQRPVRLERFTLLPFAAIDNLFNHAPANAYGGLGATFGSLNYDYTHAPAGLQAADLNMIRDRNAGTRAMRLGIQIDF